MDDGAAPERLAVPGDPVATAEAFVGHTYLRTAPATPAERQAFWAIVDHLVSDPEAGANAARLAAEAEVAQGRRGEEWTLALTALFRRRIMQRDGRAIASRSRDKDWYGPAQTVFSTSTIVSVGALAMGALARPPLMPGPASVTANATFTLADVFMYASPFVLGGLAVTTIVRRFASLAAERDETDAKRIGAFLERWKDEIEATRRWARK